MIENMNELRSFIVIAQTGSFTKAGARLGESTSALSHSMRKLEDQLKIKLFHRTTRSIATTEAGEQLFRQLLPLFDAIDEQLNALSTFRDSLTGKLRINGSDHAFLYGVWDKLVAFVQRYPEVELELTSDLQFTDIVQGRFDAGIRLGKDVEQDMIAVQITKEMQMCLVATPDYFAQNGTPQSLDELSQHQCLLARMPRLEGILQWEFRSLDGQKIIPFSPKGRLTVNNNFLVRQACLSHLGIAWLPKERIAEDLANGFLLEILPEYAVRYEGYHLYYPNRRQHSPIFQALVEVLKED